MGNSDIKAFLYNRLEEGYSPDKIAELFEEVKKDRQENKLINARHDIAVALLNYLRILTPDAVSDIDTVDFTSRFVMELEKMEKAIPDPSHAEGCLDRKTIEKQEKLKDMIHRLGLV